MHTARSVILHSVVLLRPVPMAQRPRPASLQNGNGSLYNQSGDSMLDNHLAYA